MLKVEKLENQIIFKVLGASKPKGQNRLRSPMPEVGEPTRFAYQTMFVSFNRSGLVSLVNQELITLPEYLS